MKFITSKDNATIRLAQKLKMKKYRDREGLFFIEGRRSVEELVMSPEHIHTLFVQEGYEEQDFIRSFGDQVCVLNEQLLNSIADTQNPQGFAAIAHQKKYDFQDMLDSSGFWVLLDRIADPGNLGSIIRSCWAFGVGGLLLTPQSVDPYNPKVVRSSMGGVLHLPIISEVDDEQVQSLQNHNWRFLCTDMQAMTPYYEADLTGKTILVLGSEAEGVSNKLKKICWNSLKIPINPQVDSLNVAVACAIIVAEAARQRKGEYRLL
ncbi:MAG TPA: RNA methyltransferase [Syntrophomonadaceae bacterium]|nr:RNA methyltransferase [Syntrophomonadaceae bacterium]